MAVDTAPPCGDGRAGRHQNLLTTASTIIRLTENVLRQEGEDTVDALKTIRTEHLERARAA